MPAAGWRLRVSDSTLASGNRVKCRLKVDCTSEIGLALGLGLGEDISGVIVELRPSEQDARKVVLDLPVTGARGRRRPRPRSGPGLTVSRLG
jgi:hypothetical protein